MLKEQIDNFLPSHSTLWDPLAHSSRPDDASDNVYSVGKDLPDTTNEIMQKEQTLAMLEATL